jgi:hypothetical protein
MELEAKTSFRTIAETLSTIADEIEQSGDPTVSGLPGDGCVDWGAMANLNDEKRRALNVIARCHFGCD